MVLLIIQLNMLLPPFHEYKHHIFTQTMAVVRQVFIVSRT